MDVDWVGRWIGGTRRIPGRDRGPYSSTASGYDAWVVPVERSQRFLVVSGLFGDRKLITLSFVCYCLNDFWLHTVDCFAAFAHLMYSIVSIHVFVGPDFATFSRPLTTYLI